MRGKEWSEMKRQFHHPEKTNLLCGSRSPWLSQCLCGSASLLSLHIKTELQFLRALVHSTEKQKKVSLINIQLKKWSTPPVRTRNKTLFGLKKKKKKKKLKKHLIWKSRPPKISQHWKCEIQMEFLTVNDTNKLVIYHFGSKPWTMVMPLPEFVTGDI